MKKLFATHPFAVPAAVTMAVLVLVMLVPVSFDRTVGHDVELTLAGPGLGEEQVAAIAREMKAQLGVDRVSLAAEASSDGAGYRLGAFVPRGVADVEAVASAFRDALSARGIAADARVTARVERVSSTVYAYASDRVIRVDIEGKSSAQIESEIRAALEDAGFSGVEVAVSDEGEGHRIEIKAEAEREGVPGEIVDDLDTEGPRVVLERGGVPIGEDPDAAESCTVRVAKMRDEEGRETLRVNVGLNGASAVAEIEGADSMGEQELAIAIEDALRAGGLDVEVTMSGGRLDVRPR